MSAPQVAVGGLPPRRQWHHSLTRGVILAASDRRLNSLDDPGFCLACGLEHDGVEPDAQGYECEACGEPQVFGCEELLLEVV